jgi:hypothetical protein
VFASRYEGRCYWCGEFIAPGTPVCYNDGGELVHHETCLIPPELTDVKPEVHHDPVLGDLAVERGFVPRNQRPGFVTGDWRAETRSL